MPKRKKNDLTGSSIGQVGGYAAPVDLGDMDPEMQQIFKPEKRRIGGPTPKVGSPIADIASEVAGRIGLPHTKGVEASFKRRGKRAYDHAKFLKESGF